MLKKSNYRYPSSLSQESNHPVVNCLLTVMRVFYAAKILLPPSIVSRSLTLILTYFEPSFCTLVMSVSDSSFTSSMVDGEKSRAWPTSRLTIRSKICLTSLPDVSSMLEIPARWDFSIWSQLGEVNRCTIVIELKSSSLGEIVGS